MSDPYAVIGNPVAHSKSPLIHAEFARQTGQDMRYERLLAPLDAFAETAKRFFSAGGRGLNVTVPFKHAAWKLVDTRSEGAREAEAVNTISRVGDRLEGHNTDGIGLVTDLEGNLGFPVQGKRVLLLGAGGATYGVMRPVLERRPGQLVIVNRTLGKAEQLARQFQHLGKLAADGVSVSAYADLARRQFDLVINATSAGLDDQMLPLPETVFAPGALVYDMVYGKETPFLAFARSRGANCADGLGMLVEQAAESFFIWRGVRPQTAPVISALRNAA